MWHKILIIYELTTSEKANVNHVKYIYKIPLPTQPITIQIFYSKGLSIVEKIKEIS